MIYMSFSPLLIAILFSNLYVFQKKDGYLSIVVISIYFLFFFILAPILQLIDNQKYLINTLRYDFFESIYANFIIFLSYFFMLLGYFYNSKKIRVGDRAQDFAGYKKRSFTLLFLTTLIILCAFEYYFTYQNIYIFSEGIIAVFRKTFYLLPIAFLCYFIMDKKKQNKNVLFFIILSIIILLVFKNPYLERRSALGAAYLAFIIIASWPLFKRPKHLFLLILFGIGVGFPLMSFFTHAMVVTKNGLELYPFALYEQIFGMYLMPHFDSWAQVVASVNFTKLYGFDYGHQLSGAFFILIPRFFWSSKPGSTGELLGEYLQQFGMSFTNLSAPLPAEGYLAFGLVGVVVLSALFGYIARQLDFIAVSNNGFRKFIGIYLIMLIIYILRGSLSSALLSFFLGAVPLYFFVFLWKKNELSNNFK